MEDNIAVAYQVSADNGNELEYTYFGLFDGCVTSYWILLAFVLLFATTNREMTVF